MFSSALSAQLRNQPFIKAAGFSKPAGSFRPHAACSPFLTLDYARDTLPAHLLVLPCPAGLSSSSGLSPLPRHGHRDTTSRPLARHEDRSSLLLCFRRDQDCCSPRSPSPRAPPCPKAPLPAVGPQGSGPSMHGCPQPRESTGTALGHQEPPVSEQGALCKGRSGDRAGTGQGQLRLSECGGTRSAFKGLALARLAREWARSWRQASGQGQWHRDRGTGTVAQGQVLHCTVSPGWSLGVRPRIWH